MLSVSIFLIYVILGSTPYFQEVITQPNLCKEQAKKIMKETPKNSREAVEKFFILLCARQEKEAEKVLKFADDNFPPDFNVKFNLGNLYLQRGRIDLAVFFLNQAKSIKNVPAVYDVLATAYVKYGDINSAEKTLDEGISIFSKEKEKDSQIIFSLFLKRGIIRLIKGDIKRAEDDIKQALSIYESPYALVILAEIKGKKNELNSAKELVYKASSLSDSIDIQIYSAAFLHSYGYFEEATQYYINVAEKSAGIEKYISFFMLGTIYRDIGIYMDSRDFFKMAYEYQQLATVPPPFSEAKRMELVKKYIESGNIKGAEGELREIIKIFPGNSTAYRLLVEILITKAFLFLPKDEKIKTLEEARDIAKKYLDKYPSDHLMLYNFAIVNLWLAEIGPKFARSGNIFHAISALQSALRVQENPEYRRLLGISYYLIGKYDSAVEELEKVAQDNRTKLILASAFLKDGRAKEAMKILDSIKDQKDKAFYLLLYEVLKITQQQDKGKISEVEKYLFEAGQDKNSDQKEQNTGK